MLKTCQNNREQNNNFSDDAKEGPQRSVLVLNSDKTHTLTATVRIARVKGNAFEAAAIGSEKFH